MKPLLVSSLVFLCAACANPKQDVAPVPPPPVRDTTVRAQLPVRVTWEEVSRTPTEAVVLAKVVRVLGIDTPLEVSIDVPAGAKLVAGRARFTLSPNVEADTVTEPITFAYEATPTDDAVLKLDADTGAMGMHFKVPYRFGRPPPPENPPKAIGPALKKGDKSFGPSIPVQ